MFTPVKNKFSSPSTPSTPSTPLFLSPKPSLNDRLKTYKRIFNLLSEKTTENICNMIGVIPLDIDGITYKIQEFNEEERGESAKVYKIPGLDIAVKVMPDNAENKYETEMYEYFTEVVLEKNVYNFPLIYGKHFCDACDYDEKKIKCIVVLSELYDGSLKNCQDINLLTTLFQIGMGLYVLEMNGIVHGDLHRGNVLYKESDQDNDKYLYYVISNPEKEDELLHIYVKSYGKLWVLWDFDRFTEIGKVIADGINAESVLKNDIGTLLLRLFENVKREKAMLKIIKEKVENNIMNMFKFLLFLYEQSVKIKSNDIIISKNKREDINIITF